MNRLFATCLGVWCACAALRAGPTEDAIIAIMRLSDQPNYSWTATVADDARTYDIEGRTIRGEYTHIKMPVVNSVRRKLGRSVTDTQIEMIFRGNVACVIETENGWRKPDEIPPPAPDDYEFGHLPMSTGHSPLAGARPSTGRVARGSVVSLPASSARKESAPTAYSNLQLAICHPHEELGIIVSSHTAFKVEGSIASGTLTELGAQLLLVHDGQDAISPVRATGTFKLWLRDGLVVKYQVSLDGILSVDTPTGKREVRVQQTTDTQLKEIGTTVFVIPEEARLKLKS